MEIARIRARELRESTYRSKKPCPRGHENVRRYTCNAICVECDTAVLAPRRRLKKPYKAKVPRGICEHCGSEYQKPNNRSAYCSLECRFWAKVDKGGPNDCWMWLGAGGKYGHGFFHYGTKRENMHAIGAHRVAYVLSKGIDISQVKATKSGDNHVCHTCDNAACCNPKHLYLGSHRSNMTDRNTRGRVFSISIYRKYRKYVESVLECHRQGLAIGQIVERTRVSHLAIAAIIKDSGAV